MAVTLKYSGAIKELRDAAQQATMMLAGSIQAIIRERTTPFKHSKPATLTPGKVADYFDNTVLELTLDEYYDNNENVGGKYNTGTPKKVWANTNALSERRTCSTAAMLVHECVHALSYHMRGTGDRFSHPMPRLADYKETAPYWIQAKVKPVLCGGGGLDADELIEVAVEDAVGELVGS